MGEVGWGEGRWSPMWRRNGRAYGGLVKGTQFKSWGAAAEVFHSGGRWQMPMGGCMTRLPSPLAE